MPSGNIWLNYILKYLSKAKINKLQLGMRVYSGSKGAVGKEKEKKKSIRIIIGYWKWIKESIKYEEKSLTKEEEYESWLENIPIGT